MVAFDGTAPSPDAPSQAAIRAKDRVDQWVISKPAPAGAQQASCSFSTRSKYAITFPVLVLV